MKILGRFSVLGFVFLITSSCGLPGLSKVGIGSGHNKTPNFFTLKVCNLSPYDMNIYAVTSSGSMIPLIKQVPPLTGCETRKIGSATISPYSGSIILVGIPIGASRYFSPSCDIGNFRPGDVVTWEIQPVSERAPTCRHWGPEEYEEIHKKSH